MAKQLQWARKQANGQWGGVVRRAALQRCAHKTHQHPYNHFDIVLRTSAPQSQSKSPPCSCKHPPYPRKRLLHPTTHPACVCRPFPPSLRSPAKRARAVLRWRPNGGYHDPSSRARRYRRPHRSSASPTRGSRCGWPGRDALPPPRHNGKARSDIALLRDGNGKAPSHRLAFRSRFALSCKPNQYRGTRST